MQKQKKYEVKMFSLAAVFLFLALAQTQTAFGQWVVGRYDSTGLPKAQLGTIISNIAFWLLAIFGFVAVIGFVISSLQYFLAAGDDDRQETAKKAMIYSITGVVVGLAGLVVIYAVNFFLGGSSFSVPSGTYVNSSSSSSKSLPDPKVFPSAPNSEYLPPSSLPSGWNRGGQD